MKEHSNNFETEIKTYGRQQAVQVIFEQDGQEVVLNNENVFSVTPNFKASLLKSAMKSLILDCNVEIPVGTRLQFKYGILVNNAYEYLNFGYYIVNKIEKKEDTRSYEITCYDKMMLAMVDYIDIGIEYPITIRNYINSICNHLEIDFGSNQDQFINYDKEIPNELYLDENGNSLDYTFRDVLDELAQVTASVICIDENDNLVVKYPQKNGDYETIEGTALYIENADDNKIDLELKGNTTQNGTPTPSSPVPVNNVTGEQVVTICGKNRIKFATAKTSVVAGVTISCDNNSTFTINGTKTSGVQLASSFDLQPTKLIGQYKFTGYTRQDAYVLLYYKDKNGTIKYTVLSGNPTITFNEGDYLYQIIIYINANVSATFNNETFHFQLEKGNTATPYTPNQEQNFEINLGKNLLKTKTLVEATTNGITFTPVYDGNKLQYVNVNGTATATAVYNLDSANIDYINTYTNELPSGTYILDDFSGSTSPYMAIFFRYYTIGSTSTTTIDSVDNSRKLTIDNTIKYASYIRIHTGTTVNNMKFYPQLEKGNTETSYAPYFTPIELNKIGNYQDFIRKGTGKNLFIPTLKVDDTNIMTMRCSVSLNGDEYTFSATGSDCYFGNIVGTGNAYNKLFGTLYDVSGITNLVFKPTNSAFNKNYVCYYDNNKVSLGYGQINNNTGLITPIANTKYIGFRIGISNSVSGTNYTTKIQLEKGSSATSFEPYGYKDKWYIENNVGKVVLNGSEDWQKRHTGTENWYYSILLDNTPIQGLGFCSHYESAIVSNSNTLQGFMCVHDEKVLRIRYGTEDSVTNYKTWLSSNNVTLYYVFANPTYTLIANEELIEQLDRIYLQQGLNNVLVNGNLPSTLKMTYVSDLIGIDEEQLKDINVNFGEKYGPINSLVIARAADSDFIYKEDEKSVAEDGLCEVKISDNQILNDDNRTQFIDEMFNQLRGTEFYLNDFSSTGITYLDLLDYFKVKVFDNSYKCLMLNDEINITQGLQEQVFTERPKESETEYKSIAKQDKDIKKIGIIVNKVEGEITAEIIARQDTDEKVSNLTQTIGEISTTVSTTTTQVNDLETRVQTNETSISQNSDSITATISRVQQTEDDVETLQTNTEDVVKQLVFGDDGLTISAKGTTSDDMKLNLTNDAIKFLYQNNAVLTINGSTIEFSNASFKKLDLGNYVWQAEDDDSLSLIYEGD